MCLHRGLYARPMNWRYPEEYLDFNEGLYAVAGEPYDPSQDVWGPTGFLFSDFEAENDITRATLHNNFYPPLRETWDDVQIVSNNAIVPEFRTSMMSIAANFWETTAHAAQWRCVVLVVGAIANGLLMSRRCFILSVDMTR